MEKDIVPEILEKILNEFDESLKNNSEVKKAFEILASKKVNYKNSNDFAKEVGDVLTECFKKNISKEILPDGKMYFNIADRILNNSMSKAYEVISNYSTEVQTALNKAASLNIKGVAAEVNQDRIDGLINKMSKADDFEKVEWLLDEPIKNFCRSIVDDTIKTNVTHHHKLGLKPVVKRISSGKCCSWCDKIAGTYNYPDVPKDVYRRHRHCDCIVDYYPGDGRKQNVWSKKWKDVDKSDIIEKRKSIGLKKDIDKVKVSLQVQLNFLDNITKPMQTTIIFA